MKQLRDITKNSKQESGTIDCKGVQKLRVEGGNREKKTEPQSSGACKNLNLKQTKGLQVEPKRVGKKDFDALEHRGEITNFFRRNIVLKSRLHYFRHISTYGARIFEYIYDLFSYTKANIFHFFRNLTLSGYFSLILIFLSSAFLIVFFVKHTIEVRVNRGYETLIEISEGGKDFAEIRKLINRTRFDFLLADILFQPFRISSDIRLSSVSQAIRGGRQLSYTLDHSFALSSQLEVFVKDKNPRDIYWVYLLERLNPYIMQISESLSASILSYEQIDWLPSKELVEQKEQLIEELKKGQFYIDTLLARYDTLLTLLGRDERKQYLIVFQNADEIRPTGGFMGSMAVVSMFRGRVDIFDKKDVYAIEWDLKLADYERRPAPKGINELTEFFGLRDANYFINTRDSAEAIEFFVGQAGLDIDGIIFLNQNSILRLLDISGPVYFEELRHDITKNNFSEIISLLVEAKVFHTGTLGTPKQILFDFVPVFFTQLKTQGKYAEYLKFLISEIQNREVMFWFFDDAGTELLSELGLDGQIDFSQSQDFGYPVYTSVSGNKSDRYMQRSYSYDLTRGESCEYDIAVEIRSTHAMTKVHRDHIETLKGDFGIEEDADLMYIQGTGRNRQYARYLLPPQAQITQIPSGEVVDYGSRKGLEFFLETPLLQTSRYGFRYTLPNPDCLPYSFTHYKQAGIKKYDIDISYNGDMHRYTDITSDFYFEK